MIEIVWNAPIEEGEHPFNCNVSDSFESKKSIIPSKPEPFISHEKLRADEPKSVTFIEPLRVSPGVIFENVTVEFSKTTAGNMTVEKLTSTSIESSLYPANEFLKNNIKEKIKNIYLDKFFIFI